MLRFESIQKRLALTVALGSLAFAIMVGLVAFIYEYRAQYRQARELQDQLVATVQSSAEVSAFVGNREIATEVAAGLLANPIVAGVDIRSQNGFGFARERHAGNADEAVSYPLYSPVDRTDRIGQLKVRQDAGVINQRAVQSALSYAALLIVQIVMSAGLLIVLFGRVVGRPLTRVARLLESMKPGSSERIPLPPGHGNDEIGMLVNSSNTLLGAVETAILEERRLQAEVDEMQAHYRRIFETTNVGIMLLRPGGKLLNCNSTLMSRIVGVTFDAVSAARSRDFIDAIFCVPERAWAMVWEARDSRQSVSCDLQLRSEDGSERWAHCMISVSVNARGTIEMIEGVLYDVTARRKRESEARRAAEIDLLTGLANRRGMELFVEHAIRRAEDDGSEFGVMLLDLDGFKAVNDTYGHEAGDTVLRVLGQRLNKRLRRSLDLIARLGGDEFTVVIADTGRNDGLLNQVATDLVRLVSQPIALEGGVEVRVGVSIGVASFPCDGRTRRQLLAAADAAMYSVKRGGKNGFALARKLRRLPES